MAADTSSVMTTWTVAATSKSSRERRAPGRANPSSSHALYWSARPRLKKMASQPSAISAVCATFFGPSAPSQIGTSARSGCVIGLSGLPSPVAPGASAGYGSG